MASIERRVNSRGAATYIVKYRDPDGRRRTEGGFQTKRAATSYATGVEAKLLAGRRPTTHAGKLLFREVAQTWLQSRPNLKDATRGAYAEALAPAATTGPMAKRHERLAPLRIDAVFDSYPANTIKRHDISAWIARMQAAGKSRSTIRNALFMVRMLTYAARRTVESVEPCRSREVAAAVVRRRRRVWCDKPAQFLRPAEVSALAAATPWPYNVMIRWRRGRVCGRESWRGCRSPM